jgi:GAF domain-containing protein
MFRLTLPTTTDKALLYRQLSTDIRHLFRSEQDFIANAANLIALLFYTLPNLNWCGIYLNRWGELVLGPFQGKPACIRIQFGKGVCGTAAGKRESIVVGNVQQFPGHIACDPESCSEVVIPLIKQNQLIGVLDLDSPQINNFDLQDKKGLESLVRIFLDMSNLPDHLSGSRDV